MGSEAGPEPSSIPKLPLFSIASVESPLPSGMVTPPLHTLASVPFRWEEEPGKPRPCTVLTLCNPNNNSPKCLDLPPRLLMPSPTTVLDGPYAGRPLFQSSSFRLTTELQKSLGGSASPRAEHLGAMVLSKRGRKERRLFGSWRQRTAMRAGKKEAGRGVIDDAGCGGDEGGAAAGVKTTKMGRKGSFSSLSPARSHLWTAMYKGLKQVMPWSRKSKKEGLVV